MVYNFKRLWLRLDDKNRKVHEMPCHHKLEAFSTPRSASPAMTKNRCRYWEEQEAEPGAISRKDVWYMVGRRAADASIETPIGCHTFRADRRGYIAENAPLW